MLYSESAKCTLHLWLNAAPTCCTCVGGNIGVRTKFEKLSMSRFDGTIVHEGILDTPNVENAIGVYLCALCKPHVACARISTPALLLCAARKLRTDLSFC